MTSQNNPRPKVEVRWTRTAFTPQERAEATGHIERASWTVQVSGPVIVYFSTLARANGTRFGRTPSLSTAIELLYERWYPMPIDTEFGLITPDELGIACVTQQDHGLAGCWGTEQFFRLARQHGGFDPMWLLDWELEVQAQYPEFPSIDSFEERRRRTQATRRPRPVDRPAATKRQSRPNWSRATPSSPGDHASPSEADPGHRSNPNLCDCGQPVIRASSVCWDHAPAPSRERAERESRAGRCVAVRPDGTGCPNRRRRWPPLHDDHETARQNAHTQQPSPGRSFASSGSCSLPWSSWVASGVLPATSRRTPSRRHGVRPRRLHRCDGPDDRCIR